MSAPIANLHVPHFDPIKINYNELACLAKSIFYEASGESLNGKAAVARVVLNRVNHGFAKSLCGVVYQTTIINKIDNETGESIPVKVCQFSWACTSTTEPHKNNPVYIQSKKIAYDVLAFNAYSDVVPKSTLFFHNTTVDPSWPYRKVAIIGNHVFYSKEKRTK